MDEEIEIGLLGVDGKEIHGRGYRRILGRGLDRRKEEWITPEGITFEVPMVLGPDGKEVFWPTARWLGCWRRLGSEGGSEKIEFRRSRLKFDRNLKAGDKLIIAGMPPLDRVSNEDGYDGWEMLNGA